MRIYTDKLNEFEARIEERKAGGGWGKASDLKELEAEKAAHIKTKPK